MFDFLQKKLTTLFVKPILSRYLKKERLCHIKDFELVIKPGVFHPAFFFSSTYLFDFVGSLELEKKNFLEIGCGSGLISLLAYKKEAVVTCTDINPVAVAGTRINFTRNFKTATPDFQCIESDLFNALPAFQYDVIVINPPYFFEDVRLPSQFAWNCGKNGEYFKKLFSGIKTYMHSQSALYMILAENCDLSRIQGIAREHGLSFELVEKRKIKWETNFIYRIS